MQKNLALLIFLCFSLLYFLTAKGYLQIIYDTTSSIKIAKSLIKPGSLAVEVSESEKVEYYEIKDRKYYSKFEMGSPVAHATEEIMKPVLETLEYMLKQEECYLKRH